MKVLLVALLSLFAASSFANVSCEDLQNEDGSVEISKVGSVKLVNENNWNDLDVLFRYEYNSCIDELVQTLLQVNGELILMLSTMSDGCDGGNSYGAYYTLDLKTPIAHIYDGDVYCKKDWDEYYTKSNQ